MSSLNHYLLLGLGLNLAPSIAKVGLGATAGTLEHIKRNDAKKLLRAV